MAGIIVIGEIFLLLFAIALVMKLWRALNLIEDFDVRFRILTDEVKAIRKELGEMQKSLSETGIKL